MGAAFRILGPPQVLVDGVDVTPAAPRGRALLALLIVNAGRVVSADRLVQELWPALDADRGRHVLQVRMAELRKLLRNGTGTSRIAYIAPGYQLEAGPDEIDEQRFLSLVQRARAWSRDGDVAGAAARLREAIGVWRGEPFGGLTICPSLEAEAIRLAEARVDAIEDCMEAELACGFHQSLTFELDKLTEEHPLRERLWAQRALALYRCGRQAEALRLCHAVRRRLGDELGVEPGPALRELEQAMLEQRVELDWSPLPNGGPGSSQLGPEEQPPVHYARAPGGVSIAYQVAGDGPVDLIIIPGFTSHLDVWWEPWSGRLARRLMGFCRLIVFDKRGTGLSDRPPLSGLEDWMEDARVVLDAVGSDRAVVLGMSAGGTVAARFAAIYPERTQGLILYGASPRYLEDDDYPTGIPAADVEQLVHAIEAHWGTGVLFERFCPSRKDDRALREHYATFQRASASPGAAAAYLRALVQMDVRPILPAITASTLILHATGDVTDPVERARYMADRIPNAKLVELDSDDHLIWLTDALDAMVNEIQDFVVGAMADDDVGRVLATVLSVDVPTPAAGDHVAALVDRHRGTVVRDDNGIIATFDAPERAIRCAAAIVSAQGTGPTRAGVHCGECELVGREVSATTVQIARQLAQLAHPGAVVASQTVRDLVVGSGIGFADHGIHTLAGVPDAWRAYVVVSRG